MDLPPSNRTNVDASSNGIFFSSLQTRFRLSRNSDNGMAYVPRPMLIVASAMLYVWNIYLQQLQNQMKYKQITINLLQTKCLCQRNIFAQNKIKVYSTHDENSSKCNWHTETQLKIAPNYVDSAKSIKLLNDKRCVSPSKPLRSTGWLRLFIVGDSGIRKSFLASMRWYAR